jgi:two-component system LytT family sensor kinase
MAPLDIRFLSNEQFLIFTMLAQLAVVASLATMFARFRGFRRLLLTEKRDWPERLAFAGALGIPLVAGAISRILLGYNAADLILAGPFLAGLLAGPYTGALVGLVVGLPGALAGEYGAVPFAVGCGFAGGGLREICPKDAIWHFSPFVFTDLHRYAWRLLRRFQIDWQIILIAPPILPRAAAADARPPLARPPVRLPGQRSADDRAGRARDDLCVAIPIKIWNSARIEHKLQEQEKLLMTARIEALASQINPHFLFNTLQSISSLIRSKPETARMLIVKLSALLRRLLRSQDHFVTLREELEAVDDYLDIEQVRFGRQLVVERRSRPTRSTGSCRACCSSRWSRTRSSTASPTRSDPGASCSRAPGRATGRGHRGDRQRLGIDAERMLRGHGHGIGLRNVNERLRVIYGASCQLRPAQRRGRWHDGPPGSARHGRPGADLGVTWTSRPSSSTTSSSPATSSATCWNRRAASPSWRRRPTGWTPWR